MALVEAYAGEIRLFAGNFAPRGWAFCEGQLLPVSGNEVLYSLLGTTYGGDGINTFALPDLRGCVPIHPSGNGQVGQRTGGAGVAAGNDTKTTPTLGLNYIICLQGVFPDRD